MDYKATLARLYRLSPKGVTLGLDRVARAAALLGNPQEHFFSVQIAGTNGKGSVSAILAHVLRPSGLRIGLFTSPHLHRFAERIRIDGEEAPEPLLSKHLSRVLDLNDHHTDLSLSFFEVATLAALLAFEETNVDVAVLEVGLGGRLDATTIALPGLTAVTSVALDHTALLGNTVAEIAAEKAGIARPGIPMIIGALPDEARKVARAICVNRGAPLLEFDRDFSFPESVIPPWPGLHHRSNIAVAAALYRHICNRDARVRADGFVEALPTVRWPGRFEIIQANRRYVLDCAHNMEAAQALVNTLADQNEHPAVLLYGALRDKPANEMLALYRPLVNRVVLMPPPIDRAAPPARLALSGDTVTDNAVQALEAAANLSTRGETVLVTGSLFTVAKVRELLLQEKADAPVGL